MPDPRRIALILDCDENGRPHGAQCVLPDGTMHAVRLGPQDVRRLQRMIILPEDDGLLAIEVKPRIAEPQSHLRLVHPQK